MVCGGGGLAGLASLDGLAGLDGFLPGYLATGLAGYLVNRLAGYLVNEFDQGRLCYLNICSSKATGLKRRD